jgi:hypothetical protein
MSQSTDTKPMVQGLIAAVPTFDPEQTQLLPAAELPASGEPVTPEPASDPMRDSTRRAHAAAEMLWNGPLPLPDNISIHRATFTGQGTDFRAWVSVMLHQDTGLVRLQQYADHYKCSVRSEDHRRMVGPPAVYSECRMRIDGVEFRVWTLNEPQPQAVAA